MCCCQDISGSDDNCLGMSLLDHNVYIASASVLFCD